MIEIELTDEQAIYLLAILNLYSNPRVVELRRSLQEQLPIHNLVLSDPDATMEPE